MQKIRNFRHIFGPVRSRRLGISLGVDMVPFKTCTLNCIYCECGATTELTAQRKEYVSTEGIISELKEYLSQHPEVDYVTFGGSGEPTLHTGLSSVIQFLKSNFPAVKTALLSNSTFFHLPEVRSEVLLCDLILPSLDAVSQHVFEKINKPVVSSDSDMIIEGLEKLSREFKGQIWLEVFIVPQVNDTEEELLLFKQAIERINPTRVQLNTLDRPGVCSWLKAATPEQLSRVADFLKPLPVEIISRNFPPLDSTKLQIHASSVISTLKRRPSTIEDLSTTLGMTVNDISKLLESLTEQGLVTSETIGNRIFFRS
ncbi:Radical SAM domain protein [Chitinispirillum alkaliphilum]|nr:Radical SAM domain protein [Chitinispirillum alkaliphilum]